MRGIGLTRTETASDSSLAISARASSAHGYCSIQGSVPSDRAAIPRVFGRAGLWWSRRCPVCPRTPRQSFKRSAKRCSRAAMPTAPTFAIGFCDGSMIVGGYGKTLTLYRRKAQSEVLRDDRLAQRSVFPLLPRKFPTFAAHCSDSLKLSLVE